MNAIITGASRGLGKTFAEFLAKKGFNLILVARNEEPLLELKKLLESSNDIEVSIYPCDFSNPNSTKELGETLAKEIQKIDLIINNAGIFEMGTLDESEFSQLEKMLNVNLIGAFNITRNLVPLLKKQKQGHVFNVGSIVSEHPRKDVAAYSISKIALNGFTNVLRDELKDFQVKVTELIPGSINTSSWDGIDDVPKNEFVQCEELVEALWMCYSTTAASNIESLVIRPLNRNF